MTKVLIGIGLATLLCSVAQAKTQAEILIELNNCNAGCDATASSCTSGCCGILFCRKSCITSCDSSESLCKENCSGSVIGATTTSAFFDTATISQRGRFLRVGGPLVCPDGATADIDVSVTQSNSATVGTGSAHVRCEAGETSFTTTVRAEGTGAFQPASGARACGTARIHAAGDAIEALQWCRDITLLPDGIQLEE
jgi:hypothetical protein